LKSHRATERSGSDRKSLPRYTARWVPRTAYGVVLILAVILGRSIALSAIHSRELRRPFPLHFSSDTLDAGAVPLGKPAHFEFRFANSTNRPVHILQVVSSCGCVNAEADKAEVRPGESGAVRADLSPTVGEVSKALRVLLREHPRPQILKLQARFTNGVIAEESTVDLGTTRQGGLVERVLKLRVEPRVRALPITAISHQGVVRAEPTTLPGGGRGLRLTVPASATRGRMGALQDAVSVYLGEPGSASPPLTLGVSLRVDSSVDLVPAQVSFGFRHTGAVTETVAIRGRQNFRIAGMTSSDGRVVARWTAASDTEASVAIVARSPRPATVSAYVTVVLADGETHLLPVTVRFLGDEEWRRWRAAGG